MGGAGAGGREACCSARAALPWPGSLRSRGPSGVLRPAALLRRSLAAGVCSSRRLVAAVSPSWVPAPPGPLRGWLFQPVRSVRGCFSWPSPALGARPSAPWGSRSAAVLFHLRNTKKTGPNRTDTNQTVNPRWLFSFASPPCVDLIIRDASNLCFLSFVSGI